MGGDVGATHGNPASLSVTKPHRLGNLPACNRRSLTRLSLSNFADRQQLHSRLAPSPRRPPWGRFRLDPLRPQREPSRAESPVFMLTRNVPFFVLTIVPTRGPSLERDGTLENAPHFPPRVLATCRPRAALSGRGHARVKQSGPRALIAAHRAAAALRVGKACANTTCTRPSFFDATMLSR